MITFTPADDKLAHNLFLGAIDDGTGKPISETATLVSAKIDSDTGNVFVTIADEPGENSVAGVHVFQPEWDQPTGRYEFLKVI